VDYVIAGTVWPTPSKPSLATHLGVNGLRAIVDAIRVPVLAIGGVTTARVEEVRATGAQGIAAIGLFVSADTASDGCCAVPLRATVEELRRRFDTARSRF
jgi:thiamine monophosphate synthase